MGLGFEQDFGLRICNVGCFADVPPGTGKLWEGGAGVTCDEELHESFMHASRRRLVHGGS